MANQEHPPKTDTAPTETGANEQDLVEIAGMLRDALERAEAHASAEPAPEETPAAPEPLLEALVPDPAEGFGQMAAAFGVMKPGKRSSGASYGERKAKSGNGNGNGNGEGTHSGEAVSRPAPATEKKPEPEKSPSVSAVDEPREQAATQPRVPRSSGRAARKTEGEPKSPQPTEDTETEAEIRQILRTPGKAARHFRAEARKTKSEKISTEDHEAYARRLDHIADLSERLAAIPSANKKERADLEKRLANLTRGLATFEDRVIAKGKTASPEAPAAEAMSEHVTRGEVDAARKKAEARAAAPQPPRTSAGLVNDIIGATPRASGAPSAQHQRETTGRRTRTAQSSALVRGRPILEGEIIDSKNGPGAHTVEPPERLPILEGEVIERLADQRLDETRRTYVQALEDMDSGFKGFLGLKRLSLSMPGARRGLLLSGIAYVEEYRGGRTESLEEQLRQKGVDERDIAAAVHVIKAREQYMAIRAQEAQALLSEREKELRSAGLSEQEIVKQLTMFKGGVLYDRFVAHEEKLLREARTGTLPPKAREAVRTTIEWWERQPKHERRALSVAVGTLAATLLTPAAVTGAVGGAVGYTAWRGVRSLAGGMVGRAVSTLVGKGYERLFGRRKSAAAEGKMQEARQALTAEADPSASMRHMLERASEKHKEALKIALRNKRNKLIWQSSMGLLAGLGSSVALEQAAGGVVDWLRAGEDVPQPEVMRGGTDPEAPAAASDAPTTSGSHAADVAREYNPSLHDAPDPRATAAVAGSAEIPPGAAPAAMPSIKIETGGNIWDSTQELKERLNMSDETYARAWADSGLADRDLVHSGDTVRYVVGEDGGAGKFVFESTSDVASPEPVPTVQESPLETVEVTDPYANLNPDAPVEGIQAADMTSSPETPHEHAEPPLDQGSIVAERQEWLRSLESDTPAFDAVVQERVHRGLEGVYGETAEQTAIWKQGWSVQSARDFLRLDERALAGSTERMKRLSVYVHALMDDTGLRPRGLLRDETLGHFVERMEEQRLKDQILEARASSY